MRDIANKLVSIEREVSQEKGCFSLFVLIQREDALDKWDILVSADWLEHDQREGVQFLINRIYKELTDEEVVKI